MPSPKPVRFQLVSADSLGSWPSSLPQPILYLVEFPGVCVKVGVSIHPGARIQVHIAMGRNFGREAGRIAISQPHASAVDNERVIIGLAGSEYLRNTFEEVLAFAQNLRAGTRRLTYAERMHADVFAPKLPVVQEEVSRGQS